MRNLKKILALVLALMMTLSLMATASAKDFTDADEIQYTEAVEVMSALKILEGYPNGSFGAKDSLVRAAAAKIVAYIALGSHAAVKDAASVLPDVDFTDMPTGASWEWLTASAKVLYDKGWLLGYGDGRYGTNDPLVASAFGKLVLLAAGIGTAEDYVGDATQTFDTKVMVALKDNGLLDGMKETITAKTVLNREQACQIAFNAMQYTSSEKLYQVTDAGGNPFTFTNQNDALVFYAVSTGATYDGLVVNTAETLLKKVHGVTAGRGIDNFGRPCNSYTLANGTVVKHADAPTFTLTSDTTAAALAKTLKGYKVYDNAGTPTLQDATTDNSYTTGAILVVNDANTATAATITVGGGSTDSFASELATTYTGNGDVVEIYTNAAKVITNVVVFDPTFATVTVANQPASKLRGAYTTYSVAGVDSNAANKVFSTVVNAEADVDEAVVDGTVKNGDKVLAYVDMDGMVYISAVATMTGVLSSKSSAGALTIGDKTYYVAAAGSAPSVSQTAQTFYIDAYDNILGTVSAPSSTNYAFVIKASTYNTLVDGVVVPNKDLLVINADGSVATLPIDPLDSTFDALDGTATAASGFSSSSVAITYVDSDSDGIYEVTVLAAVADEAVYSELTAITNKAVVLTTDTTGGAGGTVVLANAATKFIVTDYATTATGRKATGTATVYTGVANVPSYASTKAYAVDTSAVADGIADVVFVLVDTTATVSDNYVYVIGTYTDTLAGRVWDTIVNGQPSTLTTKNTVSTGPSTDGTHLVAQTLYSKIELDSNKEIAVGALQTDVATTTYDSVQNKQGLLFVDGSYVSSNVCLDTVPVFVIDKFDNTVATMTFADITTAITATDNVYVVTGGGYVLAIYVVVTTA